MTFKQKFWKLANEGVCVYLYPSHRPSVLRGKREVEEYPKIGGSRKRLGRVNMWGITKQKRNRRNITNSQRK